MTKTPAPDTVKELPGYPVQNSPSGNYSWGGAVGRGGRVYDIVWMGYPRRTRQSLTLCWLWWPALPPGPNQHKKGDDTRSQRVRSQTSMSSTTCWSASEGTVSCRKANTFMCPSRAARWPGSCSPTCLQGPAPSSPPSQSLPPTLMRPTGPWRLDSTLSSLGSQGVRVLFVDGYIFIYYILR